MCMAETSTMPSFTPLLLTIAETSSVMRMNSCRFEVVNQRYSVNTVIFVLARRSSDTRRTQRHLRSEVFGFTIPRLPVQRPAVLRLGQQQLHVANVALEEGRLAVAEIQVPHPDEPVV